MYFSNNSMLWMKVYDDLYIYYFYLLYILLCILELLV